MVDVGTGLAALGTAEVSKDMLSKMLGPTAGYIGEGVRDWTEKTTQNVQRVLAKAHTRLGDHIDRAGAVPPRVLKTVLNEAQFADDELIAEYLGGLLASSRSEISRDDRAASLVQLIGGLSTYAIRTHYLLYAAARPHQLGVEASVWGASLDTADLRLYMTTAAYIETMDFGATELANYMGIFSDTLLSLDRHRLVRAWATGSPEKLRTGPPRSFPEHGIVYGMTQQGIALFCAAHGLKTDPFDAFVSPSVPLDVPDGPSVPVATLLKDLPSYPSPDTVT